MLCLLLLQLLNLLLLLLCKLNQMGCTRSTCAVSIHTGGCVRHQRGGREELEGGGSGQTTHTECYTGDTGPLG